MIVVKIKKVISGDCPGQITFTAQFQYTDCRPFTCTGFMQECPAKGDYFVLEDEKFINGDRCEFKTAIKLADYEANQKKKRISRKELNSFQRLEKVLFHIAVAQAELNQLKKEAISEVSGRKK